MTHGKPDFAKATLSALDPSMKNNAERSDEAALRRNETDLARDRQERFDADLERLLASQK